jgi:predicted dehydrogenase
MSKGKMTRRAFLASTTTTVLVAGCATTKTNDAKVVPGKISPNEMINVAAIGGGGKGKTDFMSCHKTGKVNVVAIADVDWTRAAEGFYLQPNAKQYKDFRKMLEEMPEIDACTISTPDHTHAVAAYMAMNMGKHVYVQKPLTHTIAEARLLEKVAAENPSLVTQMGNQGHCQDGIRDMCEMIWSGAIGQVTECHVWTNRPIWPQGHPAWLTEKPIPAELDWDLWLGPAAMRPFGGYYTPQDKTGYLPFAWRGWWEYGCGAIGDMACHIMDAPCWALKLYEAESFTVSTEMQEGLSELSGPAKSVTRFEFPARGDMGPVTVYWRDGAMNPELPAGIPAGTVLGDEGNNGSIFIGPGGVATCGEYAGNPRLLPDDKMASYTKPAQTLERVPGDSDMQPYTNWVESMIAGKQSFSNFAYASPLTQIANFGNISLRAGGGPIEWDAVNGVITNNKEANQLLTKEYRKGWELPC